MRSPASRREFDMFALVSVISTPQYPSNFEPESVAHERSSHKLRYYKEENA